VVQTTSGSLFNGVSPTKGRKLYHPHLRVRCIHLGNKTTK